MFLNAFRLLTDVIPFIQPFMTTFEVRFVTRILRESSAGALVALFIIKHYQSTRKVRVPIIFELKVFEPVKMRNPRPIRQTSHHHINHHCINFGTIPTGDC